MSIPKQLAPQLGIITTAALLALVVAPAHAQRSVPVEVVNDGTLPVPTQPAVQPINADLQVSFSTSLVSINEQTLYTVPSDVRLVIETVSVWSFSTACAFTLTPRITTIAGGEAADFRLDPPARVYSSVFDNYSHSLTTPLKIHADPGTDVHISLFRSDNGCTATIRFSISGYLEFVD